MLSQFIQTPELTPKLNSRDKKIVFSGLFIVAAAGWLYMFYMAWAMQNMHLVEMWMPPVGNARTWTGFDFFMLFFMWLSMMFAMMTPSVVPMVMMFTTVNNAKKKKQQPFAPTWLFLLGYLLSWGLFSMIVSLIQWPLHVSGLLNPMMDSRSYLLSGGILILAGIYQFTPIKDVCLDQCRSPLGFIMTAWKDGHMGALKMGFHHGLFCVGCCWALMLILFAVGVMNMLWVILITLFVLLEKILPISSSLMQKITGVALMVWGGYWLSLYTW